MTQTHSRRPPPTPPTPTPTQARRHPHNPSNQGPKSDAPPNPNQAVQKERESQVSNAAVPESSVGEVRVAGGRGLAVSMGEGYLRDVENVGF